MNRLERLLWEEGNLSEIAKQKSRRSTWAKGVAIAFLVGACVLLASRPWPPSFADARVEASDGKWAAAQSAAAPYPAESASAPATRAARNGSVTPRVVRH